MAISQKQRHQLKLAIKRRERRPEPRVIIEEVKLGVSHRERERFTNRCVGLLLAVEVAVQAAHKEMPELDDMQVMRALVAAIRKTVPSDEVIARVLVMLAIAAEEKQADAEDWQTALRIVYSSVETHCDGRAGCRKYLKYAKGFVQRAKLSSGSL